MKPGPVRTGRSKVRIYYYFILGAMGGATGWFLSAIFLRASNPAPSSHAMRGAILGSLIGLGAGSFDGIAARSLARIVKFGGTSLLLGMIAGAAALPAVEWLFASFRLTPGSPGVFGVGLLCWVLFGALVGIGEGVTKGSQTWKAILGGMMGGFLGGGLFESIGRGAGGGNSSQTLLAFAVTVLGGGIGASVAFVTTLLQDAWLTIQNGKLVGAEVNVSKYVHPDLGSRKPGIIGSSQWESNIYLPGDQDVLPRHATIGYLDGVPTLTASPEAVARRAPTKVNGRQVKSWPLSDGDEIEIGQTTLHYRQKRR